MKNNYIESFDKKVIKIGIKEKLSLVGGFILLIVLYFMFFYVDKTPYGYTDIPDAVNEYLQSNKNYSEAYKSGKQLVVYFGRYDKDYKYNKEFEGALERAMANEDLVELYDFVTFYPIKNTMLVDAEGQEILKNEKAFRKVCRKFCVINPKKKQLYFYFEPQVRDAQYLESNLEKLEFWGAKPD